MEEIQSLVIPTLSKAKISNRLSYPIGAEHISAALATTAQLPLLKLHFYFHFDNDLRRGQYEFLRVEYLNNVNQCYELPIYLFDRPPQYRWEIVVQPVPRIVRHRIKQYIVESALPQIVKWLDERANLAPRGNDILAFFYDEKSDDFTPRQLTHLEPLRA